MATVARSYIQSLLKLVNSIIGMVGIALILYAIWMINIWYRKTVELPFRLSDFPAPWTFHMILPAIPTGSGILLGLTSTLSIIVAVHVIIPHSLGERVAHL